jgi:hypothetical protein
MESEDFQPSISQVFSKLFALLPKSVVQGMMLDEKIGRRDETGA